MIIVSNTSPLTNLAAIGRFELLRRLFREVHIADGVWEELNSGGRPHPGSQEVAEADWVRRHTVQGRELVTALCRDLDHGESETIALALEIGGDLVLMDEREGTHHAARHGLRTVGVVGLLIEAKAKGQIGRIQPELVALRQRAGFYLSDRVFQRTLELAGEQTPASTASTK